MMTFFILLTFFLFVAIILGIIWAAGNMASRTREIAKKVEEAADKINKS